MYIFQRKNIINKLEATLTGATIEHSDSGMKNNPDDFVFYEVENADAYLTADASKTNDNDDEMNI